MKIKHRALASLAFLSLTTGCFPHGMQRPKLSPEQKLNAAMAVSGRIGCSPEDIVVIDFTYAYGAVSGKFKCAGEVFVCSMGATGVDTHSGRPLDAGGIQCSKMKQ